MRTFAEIIALCGLTLLGLYPTLAWGHAFPQRSEPRVGETVALAPTHIRIWFDGPLEQAFRSIRVQNARGKQVDKGNGRVNNAAAMLLEVNLLPLSPGTYRIIWNVVARDGHRTEGDHTFIVK